MSLRPVTLALFSLAVTLSSSAMAKVPTIGDFVMNPEEKACLFSAYKHGQALVSAMSVVYGFPRKFECKEFVTWADLAATPELNMASEYATGLNYVQAVKFLRYELAKSNNAANRVQVVRAAIATVYGREPTSQEMITLQQQIAANQTWFAAIVSAEAKKLNNDKALRRQMIDEAYMDAMGRKSSAADQASWINRPEHYRLLVDAARAWLYSPQGLEDLKQTIVRALAPPSGRQARKLTAAEMDAAIAKFTPGKRIFTEMK